MNNMDRQRGIFVTWQLEKNKMLLFVPLRTLFFFNSLLCCFAFSFSTVEISFKTETTNNLSVFLACEGSCIFRSLAASIFAYESPPLSKRACGNVSLAARPPNQKVSPYEYFWGVANSSPSPLILEPRFTFCVVLLLHFCETRFKNVFFSFFNSL